MSFKTFSSAQNAPDKGGSPDKSKEATLPGQPTTQPDQESDQKPKEVAPAPKS